jgi:glycosyltransferase involved in cell wall biosynthesis
MKNGLRVLMTTPSLYPIIGGTETAVQNFAVLLRKAGIETDIMTYNMTRKWETIWRYSVGKIANIKVYRIPAIDWFPVTHSDRWTFRVNLIPGKFTQIVKKYDLIHFHDDLDLAIPLFSLFVQKPKILHLHSFLPTYYQRNFISRCLLKNVVRNYIALSEFAKQNLVKLGVPEKNVKVLPNPIDVDWFYPQENRIPNLVLFVGRIDAIKGPHILLKSLQYVREKVHLVMVGPMSWDRKYNEWILRLIEKENVRGRHNVSYLGERSQRELAQLYPRASMFVCPSLFETFGIANLEALSCATPVVASNTGAIPEIVRDGKNGLLVRTGDPSELAKAIEYLLDNAEIRRKLGTEGRKFVVENFSFQIVMRRLCKIYDDVLAN